MDSIPKLAGSYTLQPVNRQGLATLPRRPHRQGVPVSTPAGVFTIRRGTPGAAAVDRPGMRGVVHGRPAPGGGCGWHHPSFPPGTTCQQHVFLTHQAEYNFVDSKKGDVHCEGGYRSAIAASVLAQEGRMKVFDLVGPVLVKSVVSCIQGKPPRKGRWVEKVQKAKLIPANDRGKIKGPVATNTLRKCAP